MTIETYGYSRLRYQPPADGLMASELMKLAEPNFSIRIQNTLSLGLRNPSKFVARRSFLMPDSVRRYLWPQMARDYVFMMNKKLIHSIVNLRLAGTCLKLLPRDIQN